MISESMNSYDHPKFSVCLRSVQDHYNHLMKEQKRKIREEEKASGIAPEHSASDDSMDDIIERFKARDEKDQRQVNVAANKEQADADAAVAADMRKASMETFSQTKKRKGGARCEKKQEGYRIRYSSFFARKGRAGCRVEERGAKDPRARDER